jgi:hypothetical protein
LDDSNTGDPAPAVAVTSHLQNNLDRSRELAVYRFTGKSGGDAQRLEPCRHVLGAIGVQRAGPALMPSVECGKKVDDFTTAHFTDHETIRPHPQGLTYEKGQVDTTCTLGVRESRLQTHHVRMMRPELDRVFDKNNPFARIGQRQQRRQDRRLARACSTTDDERETLMHNVSQQVSRGGRQ